MNSVCAQNTETNSGIKAEISSIGEQFGYSIKLSLISASVEEVYLAKWDVAGESELTKSLFQVFSEDGRAFQFAGKMVKRGEPSLQDLVKIPTESPLVFKVKIEDYYNLTGSVGKVVYSAFVPVYIVESGRVVVKEFEQLSSNELENGGSK